MITIWSLYFVQDWSKTYYSDLWRHGVVVITTAQLHLTEPELWFCAGLNPARGVSEIRDNEDLWQWPWLEIRLNVFRRLTIPQKQFIIIIIIIIITINNFFEAPLPKVFACRFIFYFGLVLYHKKKFRIVSKALIIWLGTGAIRALKTIFDIAKLLKQLFFLQIARVLAQFAY